MGAKNLCFQLLILFSIFTFSTSADEPECIYGIYVKTGSDPFAGTESVINLTLFDRAGHELVIANLTKWGLMGQGHKYFEIGALDLFAGKGPCFKGPICALNLTSDLSGLFPGWYCEYVEVGTFGLRKECSRQPFVVEQWLDTDQPYAFRDVCLRGGSKLVGRGAISSVV